MVKKNIAFIIPYLDSGGAERVVTTLANELVNYHDVTVVTYTNKEPFYQLDNRVQLRYCLEKLDPSKNALSAIVTNYKLIKQILKIIKGNQAEVVIGFLTSANVLSVITGKLYGIKVIISERNNPKMDRIKKMWSFLRKKLYSYADILVVQTEYIKSIFKEYTDESKIVILPNPINPELSNEVNPDVIRTNEILSVGRLTDQKNHEMLIRAFGLIENKGDWKLIIIGEGENRVKCEKLIDQLNLNEKVFLIGRQKDISKYYNKCSVFAFSSNYEGFPNALIEAMHFGMACISTDCPTGPSELISNMANGLLVPMNDPKAMSEGLSLLMQEKGTRIVFGEEAKKAVDKYRLTKVVQQWENLIDNIV